MKFTIGGGLVGIVISVVLLAIAVGSLIVAFQRETTGIKARYDISQDDRNSQFNDPATALDIDDNSTGFISPGLGSGDHDNDGLTNEEERELGTDPFNPDTDGDGVADGVEILLGTDPNDPRDGGTTRPPVDDPTPSTSSGNLNVKKLIKQVRESGSQEYGGFAEVSVGSSAHFKIEAELENTGGGTLIVVLKDILPSGLSFGSGSLNDNPLSAGWFAQEHTYTIGSGNTISINISFSATPTSPGSYTNRVNVYNKFNRNQGGNASATVIAKAVSGPGSGSLAIKIIDKTVKADEESAYQDSITTSVGEILDFKINLTLQNESSETKNVILTDDMPVKLRYIPNSGNGVELFTKGYINIEVAPGIQTYEYTFSATVVSGSESTAINVAKVYEAKFAPNGAIDRTTITIL